jgi:HAD superfamily hydrolase (TIGR01549 family)
MSLTVFFDIGDVLVDVKSLMRLACYSAANACLSISEAYSPSMLAEAYMVLDGGIHYPHMNHLFGDRLVADAAIHRVVGKHDPRMVATFLTTYRSSVRQEIRPTEELITFFDSLVNQSDLRIEFGVISDGTTDEQLETLVRLNIIRYFQPHLLLVSQSFGEEKTGTAIFEEAIKSCGNQSQQVVMIGDNLDRDIKNAALAGMISIYFDRYVARHVAAAPASQTMFSYQVDDFGKLATILTELSLNQ